MRVPVAILLPAFSGACAHPVCLEGEIRPGEVVVHFDDSVETAEDAEAWASAAGYEPAGFVRTPLVMIISVPVGEECVVALDVADSGPPVTGATVNLVVHTED